MGVPNDEIDQLGEEEYIIRIELTAGTGLAVTTTPAEQIGSFPFRWEALGAYWNPSNGNWTFRVIDNGADKAFMANKVSIPAWLGDENHLATDLKHPYTFAAGSSIMIEATNNGSGTDTLYLAFIGARIPQRF